MTSSLKFAKNAAANLARGGVGAVVAIILPALLVRHMTEIYYGLWSLVLQVAAYIGYLDFGLQTAIGRYVAFANAKNDLETRDSVVSTAFAGLCAACLLGAVAIIAIALVAPHLFPHVPTDLLPAMRWTLLIVGVSVALGLPASAWNGVFVGLQRYEWPALTVGGAKIASAIAIALVAIYSHSLIGMAIVMATVNVISYAVQYWLFRTLATGIRVRWNLVRSSTARELGSYCFSLTIWSLTMLLVNGMDLLLVGRFDFSSLAVYAVAASLVTFVAGSQCAIFSAMMPQAAESHSREDARSLGNLVLKSTRGGTVLLSLTGLTLLLYSRNILRLWLGPSYAEHGHLILSILLLGNMIRLVWVPYSVVLIGAGQQRLLVIAPLLEGLSNLGFSIWWGSQYGAAGIAYGTLAGAIIGSLANLVYSIGHTRNHVSFGVRQFLWGGVLQPGLIAAPILLVLTPRLLWNSRVLNMPGFLPLLAVAASAVLGAATLLKQSRIPRRTRPAAWNRPLSLEELQ